MLHKLTEDLPVGGNPYFVSNFPTANLKAVRNCLYRLKGFKIELKAYDIDGELLPDHCSLWLTDLNADRATYHTRYQNFLKQQAAEQSKKKKQ